MGWEYLHLGWQGHMGVYPDSRNVRVWLPPGSVLDAGPEAQPVSGPVKMPREALHELLDQVGGEGWEMVAAYAQGPRHFAIFKRSKGRGTT